jgi:hypothetical protein
VYPSKKKKNPKNQGVISHHTDKHLNELKGSGSVNSFKKNSGSSNQSSTQSLALSNVFITDNSGPIAGRKSLVLDGESARKKQNARLHSSSVQESSSSSVI